MWWTPDDIEFSKLYSALKYSGVADLIAALPFSDETHSPLKDVENSSVKYQSEKYRAAVGYLLQAIRKIYNYALGASMQFVDRGDPSAWDFVLTDLITDGAWHDMDLSAIVPANAIAAVLDVTYSEGAAGNYILFRKKGNVNEINMGVTRVQVPNVVNDSCLIVALSSDGKIQYLTTNTTFTVINILVRGWFL
jgi:hypothetical protein